MATSARTRGATALIALLVGLGAIAACSSSDDSSGDEVQSAPQGEDTTGNSDGGAASESDDAASESDDEGGPEEGSLLPPAEGTTQYPLTIESWAGESVLEGRPERLAVIGFSPNLDALQALEVAPVYTISEGDFDYEWRDEEFFAGIEFVDTTTRRDPLNFEAIAASDPDLIIAVNSVEEADYDLLSAIAPVLELSERIAPDQVDWRETQRLVGEALDLSARSEEIIVDAEEVIATIAEANPQFAGRTITVAYDYTESPMEYYTVTGGTAEEIVGLLGFEPNPLAENFLTEALVSDEQLALLDADVLVVFFNDEDGRSAREGLGLFQTIPPVADGRYAPIVLSEPDSGAGATWVLRRGASPVSLPFAAEVIAENWLADVELN